MTIQPSLTIGDFCPWNTWEEDPNEEVFDIETQLNVDLESKDKEDNYRLNENLRGEISRMNGRATYLTDRTTGKRYLNIPPVAIRITNLMVSTVIGLIGAVCYTALKTPIAGGTASVIAPWAGMITIGLLSSMQLINTALKTVKIVSFFHFWRGVASGNPYNFTGRLGETGKDLLRIVATPLFIVGLQLAPIYGILRPMDGLKLQISLEQAFYDPLLSSFKLSESHSPLQFLPSLGENNEQCEAIRQRVKNMFPMVKGPIAP